jgi:cytochrome P450
MTERSPRRGTESNPLGQTGSVDTTLLSDPNVYAAGVPHEEFTRRRRECPVGWVEERPLDRRSSRGDLAKQRGTGYWAVTRHSTVAAASRAHHVFSSALRGAFLPDPITAEDLQRIRELLVNMDAPQHTATRRLVTAVFTPRAVRNLEESVQAHARTIVGRLLVRDSFDAVRDLAAELPLLVLADLLGIPRQDRLLLYRWGNNLVGFDDPEFGGGRVDVFRETFAEAFRYALQLASEKRRCPGDDLTSQLLTSEIDGRRLSEQAFCYIWILLVIAGNETTRHLLSGSLLVLAEWPSERNRLVDDPALVPTAVEELLRWLTPIMQFRRTAVAATELDGQRIQPGDKVVLYYISANRDEELFDTPHRLDLGRSPNPHLAFGVGPHFCLGAQLARLEATTMLTLLRPHLHRFELTGPVVRLASNFMNGIKSLPARFAS